MPEGDAVFRTAVRLREALDGRVLTRSDFRVPRHATADLTGRVVLETLSQGKHLLTRVEGDLTVHTHLRMDGSWRVLPLGRRTAPGDVVRLVLANDTWQAVGVRLGMVDLVRTAQEYRVVGHLGPDLLGAGWDAQEAVRRLLEKPGMTIGEALLDQRNLAGIGTIYRAETLFLRGVSPWRAVGEVGDLDGLVSLAQRLLAANIERRSSEGESEERANEIRRSSSGRDHKRDQAGTVTTGDRRPGNQTWVYGRAGRPCRRCGSRISRGEMGALPQERLILWCGVCQPL